MRLLNKDRIENFAFNIDRPFCAAEAADFCGVSQHRTREHLKALRDEGKIEIQRIVIHKYFYVWKGKSKQKSTGKAWEKTSLEGSRKADEIEDIICEKGYSSLRDIAKQASCSHEFVRQVVQERNLENINQDLRLKRRTRKVQTDLIKVLRAGKKVLKEKRQREFLESIKPYGVRG